MESCSKSALIAAAKPPFKTLPGHPEYTSVSFAVNTKNLRLHFAILRYGRGVSLVTVGLSIFYDLFRPFVAVLFGLLIFGCGQMFFTRKHCFFCNR